ncbi:uncharacterized protein LOC124353234 [Homalodisca vitripennis]|uniref:uncharacterized protein LOC124353234 n=1 Tax=Homalodisca vitripennis TaxID=197043 RepID=UPI001EEBFEEC|nr:uncharacterized protein LOC124353234 [Homalodisca vitripennis]
MQPTTLVCCILFVVLAVVVVPGNSQVLRTRTTTPLPPRRERLPYTPVRGSQRQERLPYTPVKPTTMRPGMVLRSRTTTRRVPFPTKTTPKPCNCNCNITDYRPLCAGDGTDRDTFANQCQLDCFNCTHNKRYRVLQQGECSR